MQRSVRRGGMTASRSRARARVVSPAATPSNWHVSPAVDLLGYAFSWAFVAIPAFLVLPSEGYGALLVYAVTILLIDLHRHYTLPYVYLDGHVRQSYPVRFYVIPLLFLVLWTQTPGWASSYRVVGGSAGVAMAAWLWVSIQLVRQDRGGTFQRRVAIPMYLGGMALAATATVAQGSLLSGGGALAQGWGWLAAAVGVSFALHRLVSQDEPGDAASGARTHWMFPVGTSVLALLTLIPAVRSSELPVRAPTSLLYLTFALWQTYHVLMQKYGILRIYSAKSGQSEKVPGWVDRLLIFSIVAPFLIWAGGSQLEMVKLLLDRNADSAAVLIPPLSFLGRHFVGFMAVGCGFLAICVGVFAWYEWKVHGLRNAPRLWFALGTLGLYASLFPLGVVNAYVVFATGHAIEYMVFIWAFQRRRYASDGFQDVTLSRLLRRPLLFYLSFTLIITSVVLYGRYGTEIPGLQSLPATIFGETPRTWIIWYTLYQGVLHFYYDGFLWKLRRPALRAQM